MPISTTPTLAARSVTHVDGIEHPEVARAIIFVAINPDRVPLVVEIAAQHIALDLMLASA